MSKIEWIQGLNDGIAYRVGFGGVTEIRQTIRNTSLYFIYEIYKGKILHSAVMGSAVAEIGFLPAEDGNG